MARPILMPAAVFALLLSVGCVPSTQGGAATELPESVVQTGTTEDLKPYYVLSFTTPGEGPGTSNAPVMDSATQVQTLRSVCPGGYQERFRGPVGDSSEVRVGFFCT